MGKIVKKTVRKQPQQPGQLTWQRQFAARALHLLDSLERQFSPLSARLRQDPHYRFRSLEEVQTAARLGVQIDVNQATLDDWLRLPGISIHQARRLSDLSRQGYQYTGLEDVAAVLGLPCQRLVPLAVILAFRYYDGAY